MKKFLVLFCMCFAVSAQAGVTVGPGKIKSIEHSLNNVNKIVLLKPENTGEKVNLISLKDFVSMKDTEVLNEARKIKPDTKLKIKQLPVIKPLIEEKSPVAEVKKDIPLEKVKIIAEVSEVYISYDSDKKTLLTDSAKESLKEMISQAEEGDKKIGIISYAAGDAAMAKRVSLLRASIIKNVIKGYGFREENIDVKFFGNQVNINQSKVFFIEE